MRRIVIAASFVLVLLLGSCGDAKEEEEEMVAIGDVYVPADSLEAQGDQADDLVQHDYPEPLLLFLAKEEGKDEAYKVDDIAGFMVNMNSAEYGNPVQTFDDKDSVDIFKRAVSEMTVDISEGDTISSTEGESFYSAIDKDGNTLFSFAVTGDGSLGTADGGIYPMGGGAELYSMEGVMTPADWEAYYEEYNREEDEYNRSDKKGKSVLDANYGTHLMSQYGPECINYMKIYIDYNNEVERYSTTDPKEIAAVYEALKEMKIGDRTEGSRWDEMWHIIFDYRVPGKNYDDSAYIGFNEDKLEINDEYYTPEGIKELYDSIDCEVFKYLSSK